MVRPRYLRLDTEHDAAYSLVAAAEFLTRADTASFYWKWFVLALHSAVQSSLALSLTNTDTVLVQKPGVSRKMLAAFDGKGPFPDPYMDNFLSLYAKAQKAENLPQGSIALPANSEQERAMASLDELRDEFVHFNSKSWSIEYALLVECPLSCCAVLGHLLTVSGAIRWHKPALATKTLRALVRIESALRKRADKSFKPNPLRGSA
jgi:hypothetical protein